MVAVIEYFYSHHSPWAYLGHKAFQDVAAAHGAVIRPRPVNLAGVFEQTGGLPLPKRHPVRQSYRFIEMQRWQRKRGLPLVFKPKYFPVNPELADCCAIVLADMEGPVLDFSDGAFRAVWVSERNIADEDVLREILEKVDADPDYVLSRAKESETLELYAANQQKAVEAGVVGSPCYLLNGEPFWGQDRIDLLDEALASGRQGFHTL